ncbi:MAG: ATP-binding protein [Candidatus Krumholzibacteriia bacterium]
MRLARDLAALPDAFAAVALFCVERPEAGSSQPALELVVEELFTNLVRHNQGGGSDIVLELAWSDGALRILLIDREVDDFESPVALPPPDRRAPRMNREGGLGIPLVRGLCDELVYDYRDRTVTVTAVKRL